MAAAATAAVVAIAIVTTVAAGKPCARAHRWPASALASLRGWRAQAYCKKTERQFNSDASRRALFLNLEQRSGEPGLSGRKR
ncbi:hypothetical protein T492DRAFT_937779 [Pavlovales sp. CCMP2436]|nr:hypothetical protein T492DRAFT_937779 [Pavlovales sp. CCMP2436]